MHHLKEFCWQKFPRYSFPYYILFILQGKRVACVSFKNINCLEAGPIGLPRNINLGLPHERLPLLMNF